MIVSCWWCHVQTNQQNLMKTRMLIACMHGNTFLVPIYPTQSQSFPYGQVMKLNYLWFVQYEKPLPVCSKVQKYQFLSKNEYVAVPDRNRILFRCVFQAHHRV